MVQQRCCVGDCKWYTHVVVFVGDCKWYTHVVVFVVDCKWYTHVVVFVGDCKWYTHVVVFVVAYKWYTQRCCVGDLQVAYTQVVDFVGNVQVVHALAVA